MINADMETFLDDLFIGCNVYVKCKSGKVYFIDGWDNPDGSHTLRYFNYITNEDYCEIRKETHEECLKIFYEKPIWDGKKFWDAEPELEWIDPI